MSEIDALSIDSTTATNQSTTWLIRAAARHRRACVALDTCAAGVASAVGTWASSQNTPNAGRLLLANASFFAVLLCAVALNGGWGRTLLASFRRQSLVSVSACGLAGLVTPLILNLTNTHLDVRAHAWALATCPGLMISHRVVGRLLLLRRQGTSTASWSTTELTQGRRGALIEQRGTTAASTRIVHPPESSVDRDAWMRQLVNSAVAAGCVAIRLRTDHGLSNSELADLYSMAKGRIAVIGDNSQLLHSVPPLKDGALWDLPDDDRSLEARWHRFTKRLLDLGISAAVLALACPVLLLIAVAIRLSSPGPVIFRQERVGLRGQTFTCLKFRSMRQGAQAEQATVWERARQEGHHNNKHPADPRVTAVGRILRRWSLDELPQIVNVWRGEMSIVGPRPIQAYELLDVDQRHLLRFRCKPGLTGLWQVSGRSNLSWNERLDLDIEYANHWSTWKDLSIMARTPKVVLSGEGAH